MKAIVFLSLAAFQLVTVLGLSLVYFPHPKPLWWGLTQVTSWSIIIHTFYFLYCTYLSTRNLDHPNPSNSFGPSLLLVYRDRLFAINLSISSGVSCLFFFLILPFTPKYLHIQVNDCPPSNNSCISLHAFVILTFANLSPWLLMLLDFKLIQHKYPFRSVCIEFFTVFVFILSYIGWSIICDLVNNSWPYTIQDDTSSAIISSALLHILIVIFFLSSYFLYMRIYLRFTTKKRNHYTDRLLKDFTETLEEQNLQDFEVMVFPGNDIQGSGTYRVENPRASPPSSSSAYLPIEQSNPAPGDLADAEFIGGTSLSVVHSTEDLNSSISLEHERGSFSD